MADASFFPSRIPLAIAALFGAAGVALSAAGTHLGAPNASTAGMFLLFHAPAILAAEALHRQGALPPRASAWVLAALMLGVALFSGDLALRGLADRPLFAMAAPTGGMLMILSWLALALVALLPARRG